MNENLSSCYCNNENKTKVTSAEIVVHGTVGRPYFELKYTTLDGETHIGYSSYFLPNVFKWRDECFEIVKNHNLQRGDEYENNSI